MDKKIRRAKNDAFLRGALSAFDIHGNRFFSVRQSARGKFNYMDILSHDMLKLREDFQVAFIEEVEETEHQDSEQQGLEECEA